ncbi:MAG: glycosyltransferase family 2 protein [Lachnospiraceae bacterium]|nr:glycosyltransferase family 2 protein [Lachnospiraceae bacterium]
MGKLITVIIPVYNSEQTIARCIESVINQTYRELEIIIVNDGSTDNTLYICAEYAKKDSRIVIIDKENEGPSKARNVALMKATGVFVMFADSDDYVDENWCRHLYDAIKSKKSSLALCTYYEISDKEKRRCRDAYSKQYSRLSYSMEICRNPISYYHGVLWNKIYRHSVIRKNGIRFDEELEFGEDFVFNLNYLEHVSKIISIDEPLYNYVSSTADSLSRYRKEIYKRVDDRAALFERYVRYWKSIGWYRLLKPAVDSYIVQFYMSEIKRTKKLFRANEVDEYEKYKKYITQVCIDRYNVSRFTIFLFEKYKAARNAYWNVKNYGIDECIHTRSMRKRRKKLSNEQTKRVLVYCDSVEYERDIADFYNIVKEIEDVEYYLYYGNLEYSDNIQYKERAINMADELNMTLVSDIRQIKKDIYSLCITCSYAIPKGISSRTTPVMCISPYINNICGEDAKIPHIYDYMVTGEEKQIPRFTDIFESNRRYASIIAGKYEVFIGVPHFTGLKWSEQLYNNPGYIGMARQQLNIDDSSKNIFINYSVKNIENIENDLNKLYGYLFGRDSVDDKLLAIIKSQNIVLTMSFECYEYSCDYKIEMYINELATRYKEAGFTVRMPGEDRIPYIAACDEIYTNGSGIAELAMFAEKKMTMFADSEDIWTKSNLYESLNGNALSRRKCQSEMVVFKKEYDENIRKLYQKSLNTYFEI